MRIALVTLQGVIASYGGSTKVFFDMANNLAACGFAVAAIASDSRKGSPAFQISDDVTFLNYPVSIIDRLVNLPLAKLIAACIPNRHRRRVFRETQELKIKAKKIQNALDRARPDVIISFQQETTYLLLEILHVKAPVITMIHRDPAEYFSKPEFSLYKESLNRCAYVQVLLPVFVKTAAKYINREKLVCIPNVVPQYNGSADVDSQTIINVSRIGEGKRQHLLIDAFALIANRHPNWKVECWGLARSMYAQELKKNIQHRKLQSRIKLCGETPDVISKLKKASIFVFPSQVEGFSLALTEAMSMGLAVIVCSDCPSAQAIVSDNNNGLIAESNPEAMAKKLDMLITNRELRQRLGQQAKESMKGYSASLVWKEWAKLINQAYLVNK